MFEIASDLKTRVEVNYPMDCIRTQMWMDMGRRQIQQSQNQRESKAAIKEELDHVLFQWWLGDLKLLEYEKAFLEVGFRMIDDFQGLSHEDCLYYFPLCHRPLLPCLEFLLENTWILNNPRNFVKKLHRNYHRRRCQRRQGDVRNHCLYQNH